MEDDSHEEQYWRKELQAFQDYLTLNPFSDYRDWQPTKWQALLNISTSLVEFYGTGTAFELGCGSATLLLQLAAMGWRCKGIDRSPSAIAIAIRAAKSLGINNVELSVGDFSFVDFGTYDLVFSIGVIEHLDEAGQLALLDLHFQHASHGVLIGVPNLASPVFRSFLEWARRNDCLYDREHVDISVPRLAAKLGRKVRVEDGAHLFLSRREYVLHGDEDLDKFYASLRNKLTMVGGPHFARFPRMNFSSAEIAILARVERETSITERLSFGFLNYYLLE